MVMWLRVSVRWRRRSLDVGGVKAEAKGLLVVKDGAGNMTGVALDCSGLTVEGQRAEYFGV